MNTQILIIDKKKYRLIAEDEYLRLTEDMWDLSIILKRKNERGTEAREFFAKLEKRKKWAKNTQ